MAKVTVKPSEKTFAAREHESILQAGLNAGLALGYGCSNGNCGECTARLVSGEIGKIRHHDFTLTEQEKAAGIFPMCCYQAESDIVMEAAEASAVADIPLQKIEVRVKDIVAVNEQIIKLHLRTPRSNRLRFLAGQSVVLGGDGVPDGIYPVASCPCDDMNLHFHIPNIPGDRFSEYVFEGKLCKSARLELKGPKGRFVLGNEIARPLVLICWHTGFASMQALIEHAINVETGGFAKFPLEDMFGTPRTCQKPADQKPGRVEPGPAAEKRIRRLFACQTETKCRERGEYPPG